MVVVCVLAGVAIPLIVGSGARTYEADALVYARELNVSPRVLPRLAEAVFDNGTIEARVAADLDAGPMPEIVPERLTVIAAEDSIVMVVRGRDGDPATAARMANIGAAAFAEELSRAGAGVGEFALQSEAIVPSQPAGAQSAPTRAVLGGLIGLAVGLSVVGIIVILRRPVVSAGDVEEVADVPLLGTVRLDQSRPGEPYAGPLGVRGIATVTRWLASVPGGRLALVSRPADRELRRRIYVMCGVGLWTLRSVQLVAPPQLAQAVRGLCEEHEAAGRLVHERPQSSDVLALVDGGSALESLEPVKDRVSFVAVAPRGVPRRELQALTADFTDSGLVGVVLVDVRAKGRLARGRRPANAAKRPVRSTVQVAR